MNENAMLDWKDEIMLEVIHPFFSMHTKVSIEDINYYKSTSET